ncbi:unnamed protein product [Calypogeia fissa]
MPCFVVMALCSDPNLLTRCRAVEKGMQFYSVTNSMSLVESFHKKNLPNLNASLRLPGQGCCWNGDRQSQFEVLYKYGTKRRFQCDAGPRLSAKALKGGTRTPRRLVDIVKAIPKISRSYFKSPFRRALYGGISLLGGFFVAQTISLSFGALGVNDVIAAALCLLFAEYITKYYHTRLQMTFTVALLNNFKMGFTYGLFIDAFKLAS